MAPQDREGLHYLNLGVPAALRLPNRLRAGTEIFILGKPPAGAKSFFLEFQKGAIGGSSDIALVFSTHFEGVPVVARNSCINNVWGQEQKDIQGKFPFTRLVDFRMNIKITNESYEVAVDDKPLFKFQHRCPIDMPNHLRITADVNITSVSYFDFLSSPLIATLPSNGKVGDVYTINGHPANPDADIHVNVKDGDTENDTVLLAVNPRLDTDEVVFNSWINKMWDRSKEQVADDFPFSSGKKFVLDIFVHEDLFEILVDRQKLADYKHRTDLKNSNFLVINGPISIHNVIIKSPVFDPSQPTSRPTAIMDPNIDPANDHTTPYHLPATFTIRPDGLKKHKTIRIRGHVPNWTTKLNGFQFNIKDSPNDQSEIFMHTHVRIDDSPRHTVARNAYIKERAAYPDYAQHANDPNQWGFEESQLIGDFPFRKGEEFLIEIRNDGTNYVVSVNGGQLYTFASRVWHERFARYVQLNGMVEIWNVDFF